jgi:2-C-methyl-D-erythritol 4-phosphate cytidylyltransferase
MIFAAGLGKRLGKITQSIPKALVDINGKTTLQLAVEKCTLSGFEDIIINVHHFADMVEDEVKRLNKKGFRIITRSFSIMLILYRTLISRSFTPFILKKKVLPHWQYDIAPGKDFF